MEEDQQFCLRWNNHQSTLISVFDTLLENGTLVDCTLAAEGKFLKAHKVVLSACSPYFATLLTEQYDKHPIFILKDVKYQELRAMMDYMYRGEVNISQDKLSALLKAAESLQIKGLSDNRTGGSQKPEHKHLSVPGKVGGGYTLEQTKRARLGPSSGDSQELSASREGSSSPTSRKRRKIRRRSVDNVMAENQENSNSSQPMQMNSSVPSSSNATGAITSVLSGAAAVAAVASHGNASILASNVTKKTESAAKQQQQQMESNDAAAINTDNDDDGHEHSKAGGAAKADQKSKRTKIVNLNEIGKDGSEICIEPKSEYDDGNDETVEDLTLDDEDMGLEELDQTAGPSHGGEGSSQGYAQWQVDRSQDEVFMAAQESQQRDPQEIDSESDFLVPLWENGELSFRKSHLLAVPDMPDIIDLKPPPSLKIKIKRRPGRKEMMRKRRSRKVASYVCAECGKAYQHRGNLGRHVRYECGKPGLFECTYCGRCFHQACNLQRHVQKVHAAEIKKEEI